MSELSSRHCLPCRGDTPRLVGGAIAPLLAQLQGWEVVGEHHLVKTYAFPDFARALDFVNLVAEVAEAEGHHPDVFLAWGRVRLEIWTHAIDGLSESDFILAARADAVLRAP